MPYEWIEITITVQQGVVILDAPGGNEGIDSLSDCYPKPAQGSEVPGSLDRDVGATDINDLEPAHQTKGGVEVSLSLEALQDFRQDHVSCCQGFSTEQGIELVSLRRVGAAEVVDPHTRIDQDHLSARKVSRSPTQGSFPRKSRTCS